MLSRPLVHHDQSSFYRNRLHSDVQKLWQVHFWSRAQGSNGWAWWTPFPGRGSLVRKYILTLGRFSKCWKMGNWSLKCWKFLRLTKWCDGQIGTGTGWWAIKRSLYEVAKLLILNLIIRKFSSRSESKSLARCCRMRWRSTWRRAAPSPPPPFSRHHPHHKDIIMALDMVAKASSAPPPCSPPPPPSLPPPPPCCCQAPQASSRRSSFSQSLKILQTAPRRPASVFLKL